MDIREVYAEAHSHGFDPKTMRQVIRLRRMSPEEREEHEALLDIYKGALGMLNGTPLGEAAVKRLSEKKEEEKKPPEDAGAEPAAPVEPDQESASIPEPEPDPVQTLEEARAMAREAALAGEPVIANPFPARDPRRAAWDEEWCRTSGHDGMELPEAWRRKPKKTDEEPKNEES